MLFRSRAWIPCARALEPQIEGLDLAYGIQARYGLGYGLNTPSFVAAFGSHLKDRRVAWWGGSGGSFVINDLGERMTVAFVMNKHVEAGGWDHRSVDIIAAAYQSLAGRGRVTLPSRTA